MSDRQQDRVNQEEYWQPPRVFEHEGTRVDVMTYAFDGHSDSATFFFNRGSSVFHADKHCHRLYSGGPSYSHAHDEDVYHIYAASARDVLNSYSDPVSPCKHCTQDIETCVDNLVSNTRLERGWLDYYPPGARRATARVTTTSEGETQISRNIGGVVNDAE